MWLSFFDWDGITIGTFTGLENYQTIMTDDVIRESFVHAGILVLFFAIIPIAAGPVHRLDVPNRSPPAAARCSGCSSSCPR